MMTCAARQLDGADFSTYRIGGPIREACMPETMDEAVAVLKQAVADHKPITVLGWGGNTLIASAGVSGVTLITRKMNWVEQLDDNRFEMGAGVHLAKAATVAYKAGLHGGEFMIGIPGTVGGAVRMNAGAMGQETAAVVESATVFNVETGEAEHWPKARMNYRYRHSAVDPARHIVLSAVLRFEPGDPAQIKALMDKSVAFRKAHHPTEPNGGSVFKNPAPDKPSGMLLDQLGAKDWWEGGVRVSPMHANFIVNVDCGTSTDVLKLMLRMKRAIRDNYHCDVTPENVFLGDATDEEQALWRELSNDG